jgi:hypothetical protein
MLEIFENREVDILRKQEDVTQIIMNKTGPKIFSSSFEIFIITANISNTPDFLKIYLRKPFQNLLLSILRNSN